MHGKKPFRKNFDEDINIEDFQRKRSRSPDLEEQSTTHTNEEEKESNPPPTKK
jgi:hypothetical protein